jgi:hypothetical protein
MKIGMTSLAGAAVCLMTVATTLPAHAQYAAPPRQVVTNGPQTSPGDVSPNWSARRNVIESAQYDRMLETSQAFRQARMRKECGPISDPQLHASCMASFSQDEPSRGFRR